MTLPICHHVEKGSDVPFCTTFSGNGTATFMANFSTIGWKSVTCEFCLAEREKQKAQKKNNEIFWVEITKSREGTFWYADMIGRLFQVKRFPANKSVYEVISGCAYIQKSDCRRVQVEITVKGRK